MFRSLCVCVCCDRWKQDAITLIDKLLPERYQEVIIVGGGVGGWIATLIALERPEKGERFSVSLFMSLALWLWLCVLVCVSLSLCFSCFSLGQLKHTLRRHSRGDFTLLVLLLLLVVVILPVVLLVFPLVGLHCRTLLQSGVSSGLRPTLTSRRTCSCATSPRPRSMRSTPREWPPSRGERYAICYVSCRVTLYCTSNNVSYHVPYVSFFNIDILYVLSCVGPVNFCGVKRC